MLEDPKTNVALIAAAASVASAVISVTGSAIIILLGRQTQSNIEQLKAKLDFRKSVQNARKDYEYQARKRLYNECAPAVFRFLEECERASARIEKIAEVSRTGGSDEWILDDDNRLSTLYRILAPVATFSVLRDRLTLVDLSLEPRTHLQYRLGALMADTFHHDIDLARTAPPLCYTPFESKDIDGNADPSVYVHQGIRHENLEAIIGSLVAGEGSNRQVASYVRFKAKASQDDAALQLDYLVRNFTPSSRPVFWRMLLTLAILWRAIAKSGSTVDQPLEIADLLDLTTYRDEIGKTMANAADESHLFAAVAFLEPRLANIKRTVTLRPF